MRRSTSLISPCPDNLMCGGLWLTSMVFPAHLCFLVTRQLEMRTTWAPTAFAASATLPLPLKSTPVAEKYVFLRSRRVQ